MSLLPLRTRLELSLALPQGISMGAEALVARADTSSSPVQHGMTRAIRSAVEAIPGARAIIQQNTETPCSALMYVISQYSHTRGACHF